jgi:colanic acid biosynthesis protein WcaH
MSLLVKTAIKSLDLVSRDAHLGLPDDIFYFISRCSPLMNVDLLVKDSENRVLLSWRDDKYSGTGWHIPGGIIRFQESIKTRINEVAKYELKGRIEFEDSPLALNEIISKKQKNRGHFISLLYSCHFIDDYKIDNGNLSPKDAGFLRWFSQCPENLISWHEIYREFIESHKDTTINKSKPYE